MPVIAPSGVVLGVMEALNRMVGEFDREDEDILTLVAHLACPILMKLLEDNNNNAVAAKQQMQQQQAKVQSDRSFCFFDMQVYIYMIILIILIILIDSIILNCNFRVIHLNIIERNMKDMHHQMHYLIF